MPQLDDDQLVAMEPPAATSNRYDGNGGTNDGFGFLAFFARWSLTGYSCP